MDKELNFQKAKKTFLTVTMPDDEKILVRNPTKHIMDVLKSMSDDLSDLDEGGEDNAANYEAIDRIYEACAEIMSNNIARKPVTVEYLTDLLDLEDIVVFFNSYTDFISALQSSVKN